MLGDLRILAVGADDTQAPPSGAAARHRARGAAGAVRHDPPLQGRLRRGAAQAHARARAAVTDRPRTRRASPAPERLAATHEHANAARRRSTASPRWPCAPTSASISSATPPRPQTLTAALLARGAAPVSEQAAECLRIEHGRPRYGIDLDDTVIPQEAGLNERAVSFTKGCYVGQETVARLYYKGKPNRHLRGLRLSEPAAPGEQLLLGERAVGSIAQRRRLPQARPDRARARTPRGRAGQRRERRRVTRRERRGARAAVPRALSTRRAGEASPPAGRGAACDPAGACGSPHPAP